MHLLDVFQRKLAYTVLVHNMYVQRNALQHRAISD
jgi:hypothetical protein